MYPGPRVRLKAADRQTVATGSAAALTDNSGNQHGFILKAICPAGQTIYLGASAAVTTSTGYPMTDGETLTLEVANVSEIYAIADAVSAQLAILPFAKY